MLSQCANPKCGKPFLRLREGKLFQVEAHLRSQVPEPPEAFGRSRQQRLVERYWLCDACAAQWTLISDREQGITLMPLRRPLSNVRAAGAARDGVA